MMHGREKSDRVVVPEKSPNKVVGTAGHSKVVTVEENGNSRWPPELREALASANEFLEDHPNTAYGDKIRESAFRDASTANNQSP